MPLFMRCAGKPSLGKLLGEDPYYVVRAEEGFKQPVVKLRISRLAKLIGNPELIAEYRSPGDGDDASGGSSRWGRQGWAGQRCVAQEDLDGRCTVVCLCACFCTAAGGGHICTVGDCRLACEV